jgi:hypothetical protein
MRNDFVVLYAALGFDVADLNPVNFQEADMDAYVELKRTTVRCFQDWFQRHRSLSHGDAISTGRQSAVVTPTGS